MCIEYKKLVSIKTKLRSLFTYPKYESKILKVIKKKAIMLGYPNLNICFMRKGPAELWLFTEIPKEDSDKITIIIEETFQQYGVVAPKIHSYYNLYVSTRESKTHHDYRKTNFKRSRSRKSCPNSFDLYNSICKTEDFFKIIFEWSPLEIPNKNETKTTQTTLEPE
jgi:hypothetical protein